MKACLALAMGLWLGLSIPAAGQEGLTAVEGIRVGHFTLPEAATGCTVILADGGAVAAVDVRGGAPGTRETDLLKPENMIQEVHAVVLSGGSAFGLETASGVMRYLEAKGIGYEVGGNRVPIVPAAILFDLRAAGKAGRRPDSDCGYQAAASAASGSIAEGSVGAGAGATVGKLGEPGSAMKGGIGTSAISLDGGLVVAALVAVNAVGDVVDPETGRIVAGVRSADGGFADARKLLRTGALGGARRGENTTIGVIATNARLNQAQATKVAQMAHDGLARTIYPAHTPADGDTLFVLATGKLSADAPLLAVGALAAEVTAQAVLRAVREAKGIAGYPAARDLESKEK